MLKKALCIILSLSCVLSFAACGGSNGNKNGGGESKNTSGGIQTAEVDAEVLKTKLATKDYRGEDFTFYYWYETNEIINRKVAAFNKAHNANVSVTIGTDFANDIAKSIADGTPYDLIANHCNFFPQTIFSDLYEPLEGYIEELDYYNADKPNNWGISKTVNEAFTWNGKLYAAGSTKAVYPYAFYYNKKAFSDAGLEDPYTLWKAGKWTWDKAKEMSNEVTDIANSKCFLSAPELFIWLTLNGVSAVKRDGQNFTENLGDKSVLDAMNSYSALFVGDNPMSLSTYATMANGKAYASITYTDAYTVEAKNAKNSSAFGKDSANLGVVPVPSGLTPDGKYAAHVPQGYSAAKGAKDPSVAACYALFESRTKDSDTGSALQMPSEIRNYIDEAFAKNGFLGYSGLRDSEGKGVSNILSSMALDIQKGADVASTVAAQRNAVTRIISDCLSRAK